MNNYTMIKGTVGIIAGAGASKVVKHLIKQNVFAPETKVDKILMNVGVFAITGIVSDQVSSHTEKRIDSWRDSYEKIAASFQQAKESKAGEELKDTVTDAKATVVNAFQSDKGSPLAD